MTAAFEVRNLSKAFGNVRALQDVSLTVGAGRITALVGDNGAGKSTLVRCLAGVHAPDSGRMLLSGREVRFASPDAARSAGIETVHQNLALVEDLTVAQNLFLGRESRGRFGFLDRRGMRAQAARMLERLAVNVPSAGAQVRRLSGGQRQAVAICRAASWGSRLVIMDEPTAALGVQETQRVEDLIRRLRHDGVTVVLVSHDFDQVLRLSDEVWVMRAGEVAGRRTTSDTGGEELVALVTGAVSDRKGA